MVWEPVALVMMIALGLAVGLWFRLGGRRGAARWYFDEDAPWYLRHMPFGLIPFSCMAAAWVVAVLLIDIARWTTWLAVSVGALFMLVAVRFMYRPPDYMKPRWIREQEAKRQIVGPERRGGFWKSTDKLAMAFMVLLGSLLFLIGVLMLGIEVANAR